MSDKSHDELICKLTAERDEARKWSDFHDKQAQRVMAERDEHRTRADRLDRELRQADERAKDLRQERDSANLLGAEWRKQATKAQDELAAWKRDEWPIASQDPKWGWFNERLQDALKARDGAQEEVTRLRDDASELRSEIRGYKSVLENIEQTYRKLAAPASPPAPTYSTPALPIDPEAEAKLERRLAEKRAEVKAEPNQCCAECRRVVGDGPGKSNCAYDFACECHKAEPAQGAKGEDKRILVDLSGIRPATLAEMAADAALEGVDFELEEAKAEAHAAGIAEGMERAAKIAEGRVREDEWPESPGSMAARRIAAAIRKAKEGA